MRQIDEIIIHCADTPDNSTHWFDEKDIDSWHVERGWHRNPKAMAKFNPNLQAIGYHYVICRDGSVRSGRSEDEIGSHAAGYNSNSIGVCLIGTSKFTPLQWNSLQGTILALMDRYPGAVVKGHYEVATNGKTCPNFNVQEYMENGLSPNPESIYVG